MALHEYLLEFSFSDVVKYLQLFRWGCSESKYLNQKVPTSSIHPILFFLFFFQSDNLITFKTSNLLHGAEFFLKS